MNKKTPPQDDKNNKENDNDIFYQSMKDVTPLTSNNKNNKIRLSSDEIKKKKTFTPLAVSFSPPLVQCRDQDYIEDPVESDHVLAYRHISVSDKTFKKLRKGQFSIEAVLDLHGKTVQEAKISVEYFLSECLESRIKTILIIHGKGSPSHIPILKNKINNWLQHLDVVLAFSSATVAHGGQGAVYVLLKSSMK